MSEKKKKFNNFFKSLRRYEKIHFIKKTGLPEETINNSKDQIYEGNFLLKHLCVVKDDNIISNVRFDKKFTTSEETNIINKFDYKIYIDQQIDINLKIPNSNSVNNINQEKNPNEKIEKNSIIFNASNNDYAFIKNNSSLPYGPGFSTISKGANFNKKKTNDSKNNNNNFPNFDFFKIYIKTLKIVILKKSDFLIISFFCSSTKNCLIKNYLLHMYVVYSNFFFNSFETAKIKYSEVIAILTKNMSSQSFNKKKNKETQNSLNNLQSKPINGTQNSQQNTENNNENKLIDYSISNEKSIFMKLMKEIFFELYIVFSTTKHFENIMNYITIIDDWHLPNRKLKNIYAVDINSGDIIFDLMRITNIKKYKKVEKNKYLWQEIIFHLKNLQTQYINEHKFSYDLSDSIYNFVKLEFTSSFPRLSFVLKFLPILGGIGFIEIFSQKKLSRNTEIEKIYKEINICYGSDIKLDSNVDFIYQEPKKLKEIEKFFLEFFVVTNPNKEFFYSEFFEIKYFDLMLIACMNEILRSDILHINTEINGNNSLIIETMLYKVNNLFCDLSTNPNDAERLKIGEDQSNDINSNMRLSNMNDTVNFLHRNNNLLTNRNFNNNLMDSVNLQNIDSSFLIINKDLILKQIYIITNKFQYLIIPSKNNNITLNLTKNDNYFNTSVNGIEPSLDLSIKFSDISILENERINYQGGGGVSSSIMGNQHIQNIVNNISPSYDYVLNNFQRNITDESEIRNACKFMQSNQSNMDGGIAIFSNNQNITNSSISVNDINFQVNVNPVGNVNQNNNRINTLGSINMNVQNTLTDKPQINIQNMNSHFRNKFSNNNYNVNGNPVKLTSNASSRNHSGEKPPIFRYSSKSKLENEKEKKNENENGLNNELSRNKINDNDYYEVEKDGNEFPKANSNPNRIYSTTINKKKNNESPLGNINKKEIGEDESLFKKKSLTDRIFNKK